MQNTANQGFIVNAGGAFAYLGRVKLIDGSDAMQADIASIVRTVTDTKTKLVTTTNLDVADVIFETLQADSRWLEGTDQVPWNFEDRLPASAIPNRRKYLLQYTFTPSGDGEPVKSREVDVTGD